jgi:hypothetical protein
MLETPVGRYLWHENWASVPGLPSFERERRTHGVAVARSGRVYVFHQAVPAMLVYGADGCLVDCWGDYPGAHGLTLVEEDGEEFLWLTDQKSVVVEKTTLDGRVVGRIEAPSYADRERYIPTWVAVNERCHGGNGDIWIADGYGSSRVTKYDGAGNHLSTLDGATGAGRFLCPHGIWFDSRKRPAELYIADRGNHRVQVYDAEGNYQRSFGEDFLTSPDGFASDGNLLILPELRGRITILDANDHLICHLGRNEKSCDDPLWPDATPLWPGRFNSPHGAASDTAGNIFVVEWRAGGRILKLEKQR